MKHDAGPDKAWAFAELQADYGPYHFPELALQRIWRDLQFEVARLVTADGRPVEVIHPGAWNRLGGPDFRGACLRLGGERVMGDIEVHVHARDWQAHGHDCDPNYANVILHVVLFPVPSGVKTRNYRDHEIPSAALLDLIPEDLESHAAAFALEALGLKPTAAPNVPWQTLSASEREASLRAAAIRRWERKVADAEMRVSRLGWDDACHTAALEVLGYSRNRLGMLRIAGEWPLARWRLEPPLVGQLMASQEGRWSRQGFRPDNHPATRLCQYARWVAADPRWPDWLRETDLTGEVQSNGELWKLGPAGRQLRRWFRERLCAGAVGGRRADTLVCDAFLPLLAALGRPSLESAWLAWPAGDIPRAVEVIVSAPTCRPEVPRPLPNGWVQGIWGWLQ